MRKCGVLPVNLCIKNYMMKGISLIVALLLACAVSAQENTSVEAKLFVPANVLKGVLPTQPLVIHYVVSDAEGKMETGKMTAKRVKDNLYSFSLKQAMYFRLVFVIGDYTYNMPCVNNRNGTAAEDYYFNVLLEKKKFDPKEMQFIMPCIVQDEEVEE